MSADMSQSNEDKPQLQVSVAQDLEYVYRDLFNLHVGAEDVVIEFGNVHRGTKTPTATMHNRIVLSMTSAMRLQQALGQVISQVQQKIRDAANQQTQN